MTKLSSMLEERRKLEMEIDDVRREERSAAIGHIGEIMALYGLKVVDIDAAMTRRRPAKASTNGAAPPAKRGPSASKGRKAPIKYRDKKTGDAWSGRGLKPRWLVAALKSGRKLEDFAV